MRVEWGQLRVRLRRCESESHSVVVMSGANISLLHRFRVHDVRIAHGEGGLGPGPEFLIACWRVRVSADRRLYSLQALDHLEVLCGDLQYIVLSIV